MNRRRVALMLAAATLSLVIAACVPAPTAAGHWAPVYRPAIDYGPAIGGPR